MQPDRLFNNNKLRNILLICNDRIKQNMAGPAIRYWEFATVLNKYFAVTLAIPPFIQNESFPQELNPTFQVLLCKTQNDLQTLALQADVILTVGNNLSLYPFLAQMQKPLILDMYIPFMLEDLQKHRDKSIQEQNAFYDGSRGSHTLQIRSADFIICANEKQRDFWLGWLGALGRINPYTHQDDPSLFRLIDIVPFGLSTDRPLHDKPVLKGIYKNITKDDKVILWGGGLWNWLDPQTLIKAMKMISEHRSDVKLFFMGIKSPNPASAKMETVLQSIQLSQELGLYDECVFFNEWAPYQERHNYLLEADVGVSLHRNHIETRFAFRTRLLDYIWAGLPMVVTGGDSLSEKVTKYSLGKVVKSGDVEEVSQALLELLETPNLREQYETNFDQVRTPYEWETVMQPLINFCRSPYFAADKPYQKHIPFVESGISSWWMLPGKVIRTARQYGLSEFSRRVKEYLKWKLQR